MISGMYSIKDDDDIYVVFVLCTIPGQGDKEHGFSGEGKTEDEAMENLQAEMIEWKGYS